MLRRVFKKSHDSLVEEEANEYFFNHYEKNKEKLKKGIDKGEHHIPIMHYNTR
jgi:hypothetical protein